MFWHLRFVMSGKVCSTSHRIQHHSRGHASKTEGACVLISFPRHPYPGPGTEFAPRHDLGPDQSVLETPGTTEVQALLWPSSPGCPRSPSVGSSSDVCVRDGGGGGGGGGGTGADLTHSLKGFVVPEVILPFPG